jgi:hypothetical protein
VRCRYGIAWHRNRPWLPGDSVEVENDRVSPRGELLGARRLAGSGVSQDGNAHGLEDSAEPEPLILTRFIHESDG